MENGKIIHSFLPLWGKHFVPTFLLKFKCTKAGVAQILLKNILSVLVLGDMQSASSQYKQIRDPFSIAISLDRGRMSGLTSSREK